jgi:hypothetical protein
MSYRVKAIYWPPSGHEDRYLAAWNKLGELLADLPVTVLETTDDDGRPARIVTCETMRGRGGAHEVHDLACRYGALPVIL